MKKPSKKAATGAAAPLAPAAPGGALAAQTRGPEQVDVLTAARSGTLPIGLLLEQAQALAQRGLNAAAAELYEAWIAHTVSPHLHVACFNWGTVLGTLKRHQDAETALRRALALNPGFAHAKVNLGHQLEHLGQTGEALAEWQSVVDRTDVDPDLHLHARNSLARVHELLRQFDRAEAHMRASLEARPAQPDVVQHYVHIRQKQCAWPVYAPVGAVTPHQLLTGTSPIAMLSAHDDPALQLLAAQRFVHERVPKPPAVPLHAGRQRSGKVRLGYLSGDLHLHAVGLLTVELLELHDRSRFEVHAYSWSRDDGSPLRARLRRAIEHYVPIAGLDDATAAQRIADDGIDVLIDLQGLTSGARPAIVGHRPAPVQVSYLGFPGTCALPGIDWIVADRHVMPPELLPFMAERPMLVPRCYQVSDRQRPIGTTPTRAACALPDDAVVYCSFNNNFKFTAEMFACWMRILAQVPGSVLWLLADNAWSQANLLAAAAAHGIAAERLVFAPRVVPHDYLARFQVADLMLDTFPYNAGTTASDALWMGLPILTRSGRSYISRMATSLLENVGLPDLVTTSLDDYERLAVQLGRHPQRLASYKRYLAEYGRTSSLFDVPTLVRDIEDGFERLGLAAR